MSKETPDERMDRLTKAGICPYCENTLVDGFTKETACCINNAKACKAVMTRADREVKEEC